MAMVVHPDGLQSISQWAVISTNSLVINLHLMFSSSPPNHELLTLHSVILEHIPTSQSLLSGLPATVWGTHSLLQLPSFLDSFQLCTQTRFFIFISVSCSTHRNGSDYHEYAKTCFLICEKWDDRERLSKASRLSSSFSLCFLHCTHLILAAWCQAGPHTSI